ncbi:MAG: argininosuccinate lyase [Deltaproteobacteria bacterium]|nr:argininosuccinate lyase [Deltaproteobacteria bacterium]MBW1925097.1 argininosuccinate lyase [Deltaproteobacteria bacterium]MBW1950370.1 argininosuccinate lyase [Deltaproteobacteria bacterium]MBW2008228.1 argininosuccinate lyase [Deltaproteobacteria bacterium]MBW2102917.1 argininosuccinate lyase [Deltaproteobacteria bacterium]
MSEKLWGGRFREETDVQVDAFNASIGFDWRLFAHDIEGSMAHCRMLAKQGIITEEEAGRIIEALGEIRRELEHGEYPADEDYEDIHSLVEKALVDKVGPLGEKLHTGRSRNDQVALDARLFVREAVSHLDELLQRLQEALLDQAEKNVDLIMPGYTHLQRAQPVLLAHHLMAYFEMFHRDRDRLRDALKRVNVLPLGSAALAGSTFDLDRDMVAEELGFEAVSRNSMDAVSDRDFVLEYLACASILMMHLSRLCEELVLWSSREFGFAAISDAFCTGSSIMPQKKNPDIPELIRGKTGRVYGHLVSLLTTMKGLPLAYNKDMQEDKEALFDTVDTVEACVGILARLMGEVTFHGERMLEATQRGYLAATDLADYLVRKGMTFRQAHETVGRMVLFAVEQGKELHELTLEQMKGFARRIEKDVYEWLDPVMCLDRRNITGGTGPGVVRERLKKARRELGL